MKHLRLRDFANQLVYIPRTLRLIWEAAPGWTVAWALLLLIQGFLPAANVYLTRLLVDSLTVALGGGVEWSRIQPTVAVAGLMALVMLLSQLAQGLLEWVRTGQAELIRDHLAALVHRKAVAADLAYFELPEYHDRLYQATSDLRSRPLTLLESSGSFGQSCITLVTIGALLIPYGLWLPLALVVSTLPAFLVVMRFDRMYHRWWEQTTVDRRWVNYFDVMLILDTVASEIRLFNLGDYFQGAYQRLRRQLRHELLQLTKKQGLGRFGAGLFAAVMVGAAMAWMVWRAFLGQVTLGDLALFYQALNKSQNLLRSLLGEAGRIYNNTLFLENLFKFLEIKPQVVDPVEPRPAPERVQHGLQLRQVTFRYPGSSRPVFDQFDFFIPANKVVAIVGANGAGKTTLVKLLCRLYDPEAGVIELDGIDIKKLRVNDYRGLITGMFQFPVHYFSTVSENIAMGRMAGTYDEAEVEQAARRAGAHEFITRLPQGYHTLLGKLFPNGADLSGGEWQRLALARSFYRQARLMILDEPTSFVDSWAEIDWFDRFRELAAGRTTVLITHRFTIARHADIIHVMENGQIIESGTHEALLEQGGRYARSWWAQTKEVGTTTSPKPNPSVPADLAQADDLADLQSNGTDWPGAFEKLSP
jgi:ATP-binding cassette subfamily B protein